MRNSTRSLFLGAVLVCTMIPWGWPIAAQAEEFELFGVRFGMTREQIDNLWLPLSGGTYAVPKPSIRQVEPAFDHEGKLYKVSFLIDLPPDYPPGLLHRAFRDLVESKWGQGEPGLNVDLMISPNSSGLTVTSRKLQDAYVEHIGKQLAPLLQP